MKYSLCYHEQTGQPGQSTARNVNHRTGGSGFSGFTLVEVILVFF